MHFNLNFTYFTFYLLLSNSYLGAQTTFVSYICRGIYNKNKTLEEEEVVVVVFVKQGPKSFTLNLFHQIIVNQIKYITKEKPRQQKKDKQSVTYYPTGQF